VSITKSASSSFERQAAQGNLGGGAKRYCNPEEDLPQDFEAQRETYYQALKQPMDATAFITQLQQEMAALTVGCRSADNEQVNILKKTTAGLEFLGPQPEPLNLLRLKGEIGKRWPMTSLLTHVQRSRFTDSIHRAV